MGWSRPQQVALAILPKFSSLFSLFGSTWIAIEVFTCKHKWRHPYHRMLFAMSLYDIAESIFNFLSTWMIPRTDEGKVWAVGNRYSCTLQGFFLTLSVAVPIYNAFLAFYYMLVVNYNLSEHMLRRRVEPAIHGVAFVWAFGTAFSSAVMGLMNDANLWCWIAPYPSGCKDSWRFGDEGDCERGDNAWIYRWAFYFAPLWFCILSATVCTFLVFRRVRKLDERTLQYRRPEMIMDPKSMRLSRRRSSLLRQLGASTLSLAEQQSNDSFQESEAEGNSVSRAPFVRRSSIIMKKRRFNLAEEEEQDDAFLSGGMGSTTTTMSLFGRWRESREIYREDYARSVEVAEQALWYLGTFYITHVWSTTNRILQQVQGKTLYPIILIHSWFDPFQGFLNYLVYQRPRYKKIRKHNPAIGRVGVAMRALRFTFMPTLPTDSEIFRSSQFFSQKSSRRDVPSTASSRDGTDEPAHGGPTQSTKMNASMPSLTEESSTNDMSGRPSEEPKISTIHESIPETDTASGEFKGDTEGSFELVAVPDADPTIELVSELQFSAAHIRMLEAFEERAEHFEASRLDL